MIKFLTKCLISEFVICYSNLFDTNFLFMNDMQKFKIRRGHLIDNVTMVSKACPNEYTIKLLKDNCFKYDYKYIEIDSLDELLTGIHEDYKKYFYMNCVSILDDRFFPFDSNDVHIIGKYVRPRGLDIRLKIEKFVNDRVYFDEEHFPHCNFNYLLQEYEFIDENSLDADDNWVDILNPNCGKLK